MAQRLLLNIRANYEQRTVGAPIDGDAGASASRLRAGFSDSCPLSTMDFEAVFADAGFDALASSVASDGRPETVEMTCYEGTGKEKAHGDEDVEKGDLGAFWHGPSLRQLNTRVRGMTDLSGSTILNSSVHSPISDFSGSSSSPSSPTGGSCPDSMHKLYAHTLSPSSPVLPASPDSARRHSADNVASPLSLFADPLLSPTSPASVSDAHVLVNQQ